MSDEVTELPPEMKQAVDQAIARMKDEERQILLTFQAIWWEGHRDVCTDCNCRPEACPYNAQVKKLDEELGGS